MRGRLCCGNAVTFCPDEGVSEIKPGTFGCREFAKAGTVNVTPLGPIFSDANQSVPAGVHDGVVGDPGLPEHLTKQSHQCLFRFGLCYGVSPVWL